MTIKSAKYVELNVSIGTIQILYFLEHSNFKDDLIESKCSCYNKSYKQQFGEKSK